MKTPFKKNKKETEKKQSESSDAAVGENTTEQAEENGDVSVKNKGKRKKIIIIVAVAFVLVLGFRIAMNNMSPEVSKAAPINVHVATAGMDSIYSTSPLSGRIQPISEVAIIPLAAGEITNTYVALGDYVTAGTVLFEIDKTQASTTYNQTKESYNSAKSAYDRMKLLYNEGAVSLQSYEQAETQYMTTYELYKSAADAYNNCIVKSPIDGYVTSFSASVGSLASTGMVTATVADTSALEINASVSEYLIAKIKVNDPVGIIIASLGEKEYEGMITAVSPAPAAGGLTYPITISVTDKSEDIMAGMFAEIKIKSDEKDDVVIVPSDAVIIKGGRTIAVKLNNEEDAVPSYVEVETGLDNGEFVEVISGIKTGDIIVTSGQQYVTEGVAVNIVEQ